LISFIEFYLILVYLDALQRLRQEDQTNGRTKVVSYLEAVSEEVVFEMKVLPRS
jgi:hypothetical protein